jgi:hypothetical protein
MCKLILAVLLALAVSVTERPISAATLADNLNQPTSATELVTNDSFVGASFETSNYDSTLKQVDVRLKTTVASDPLIQLYSDSGGAPGVIRGSLGSASANASSELSFSGNGLLLTANTTYWIVAKAESTNTFEWSYANTNSGVGPGFQPTWAITYDSGITWFTEDTLPMQMRVEDSSMVAPEPGSTLLVGVGVLAVLIEEKYRRSRV